MPPVIKYSKEKILEIGLKMVEKNGIESISARNIAKELGCSICPIFSCFESMDSLKDELLNLIFERYSNYIKEGMNSDERAFKGAGLAYIKFAKENKNYFKALFMNKTDNNLEGLLKIDFNNKNILAVICKSTGLNKKSALKLHKYNWIFVHGIAVMVATDYCVFTDDEVSKMLTEEYIALLNKFKEELKNEKDN